MTRHDSGEAYTSSARRGDPWMPPRSGQSVDNVPSLPGYRDFVAIARSEGSEVYRAYQDGVDRPVAVKVLLLDDPEAVARFHRELEITVQLGRQHPHIVTVIDTGTTSDGRPCIVMEHYDRGSLHDRLRARGPLAWDEVLAAGTVVADALSFAHRHGVLHRDVKPQNILVLPTSYVVADFGIARRIDAARTTSVEWFSFRHAAPQVLDGEPPAVADDIWSVGSTLFTLLDGLPPFALGNADEDTALAYMKRVRIGHRRALNRHDVPAGLVAIIDRCLQHDRADRFPDAAALHATLAEFAAETRAWAPPSAAGPPLPSVARPPHATAPPGATGPVPADATGRVPARAAGRVPAGATGPAPGLVEGATVKGQPAAVSPSALAQVVASQVAAGGYAVGDETIGPRYTEPPSVEPTGPAPVPSGNLRRILVGTAVALLVGGVLGVGGTWVAGLTRSDAGESSQGQRAAPTSPAAAGPGAATSARPSSPTARSRANPAIAPVITSITAVDGTKVRLRWQDRSRGRAQFVVVRVPRDGGDPKPANAEPLPNDRREYTVEGLDPASGPHCFVVLALTGGENGASEQSCAATAG